MIVFDLRCAGGHVFEAWFASSAAWEEQRARRLVRCPICDDADVGKAVMAPAVATKGNRAASTDPAAAKAALHALAAVQARALAGSTWVGGDFATRARAMHDGVEPAAPIHGQATATQTKALLDDGVPVLPLPLPVVAPDRSN